MVIGRPWCRALLGLAVVAAFAGTARAQSPAAAPTSIAVGDWQLSPALEVRTRGEFRSDSPDLAGYGTSSAAVQDAYGILERTRIGLGAEYGAVRGDPGLLRALVTIQDARAWGVPSPSGILGAEPSQPASTALYEGWLELRTSAARPAFLRVGRQAVTWGDGRLLSNADWSPVARTLDAIRGHVSAGVFDFEVLGAILETPTPLGPGFGQTTGPEAPGGELFGAQAAAFVAPLLKAELSFLGRVRANTTGETYVGSLRVFGEDGGWRYAVEGAFELQRSYETGQVLPAWAGAGYVEKTLESVALSPTLRLEGDGASGVNGSNHAQFDPILPDVHQMGAMDLFAWSNTLQAAARVSVVPWAEGTIAAEYRYVWAAEGNTWLDAYLNQVANVGAYEALGQEIDLWARWRPWPVLDLIGGDSILVPSVYAQNALSYVPSEGSNPARLYTASFSNFAYLQATLRVP
jgi:Alginate export